MDVRDRRGGAVDIYAVIDFTDSKSCEKTVQIISLREKECRGET